MKSMVVIIKMFWHLSLKLRFLLPMALMFFIFESKCQISELADFKNEILGSRPCKEVLVEDNWIYGMTEEGGNYGFGTVYKVHKDGTDFSLLHSFNDLDGKAPVSGILKIGNQLYGTCPSGGEYDKGVLFKMNDDGTEFQLMQQFQTSTASTPLSRPVLSNGYLFGTLSYGGAFLKGAIYKVLPDGSDYQVIFHFDGSEYGASPSQAVVPVDGYLYGTTSSGGNNNNGTVYRVKEDGSEATSIFSFFNSYSGYGAKSELILVDTQLYGVTREGGSLNGGVVYRMNMDGTGFTKLVEFNTSSATGPYFPDAALVLVGSTLFGSTTFGGEFGNGVVFSVTINGSNLTYHKHFDYFDSGSSPGTLFYDGSHLCGTSNGGSGRFGVLFRFNNDGTEYTAVHEFLSGKGGNTPYSGMIAVGDNYYGITRKGGLYNYGCVFTINRYTGSRKTIFSFDLQTNGAYSEGELLFSDGKIYGTLTQSAGGNPGLVFRLNPNGSAFEVVHCFTGMFNGPPMGNLACDNDYIYGTAKFGGVNNSNSGYIYRISKANLQLEIVRNLQCDEGRLPIAGLTLSGDYLYATTVQGGNNLDGTLIKLHKNGSEFEVLHHFEISESQNKTITAPVIIDNLLYGTSYPGGANEYGNIYRVSLNTSEFNVIHIFSGTDGISPQGKLCQIGTKLFGVTRNGGMYACGSLYSIDLSTEEVSILHHFQQDEGLFFNGGLLHDGPYIVGTAQKGGDFNLGTVFRYYDFQLSQTEESSCPSFSVFPNPACNMINIRTLPELSNAPVIIRNAQGYVATVAKMNQTELTLDINQLSPGFYVIQLGNDSQANWSKLVIE